MSSHPKKVDRQKAEKAAKRITLGILRFVGIKNTIEVRDEIVKTISKEIVELLGERDGD